MKIAGLKNDGAWFRFNTLLRDIRSGPNPEEVYEFSSALAEAMPSEAAFGAIQQIMAAANITPPESPANASAWLARMVDIGIPRQIWMGRLSFTTYARSGSPGSYEYTAEHQDVFHTFGKVLRKQAKIWTHARRAAKDLLDIGLATQGNPGGQPDATPDN